MRKYTKYFGCLVFIFCFSLAFAQKKPKVNPLPNYIRPDTMVSSFWGKKNIPFLFQPDSVVVFRISPQKTVTNKVTLLAGYEKMYSVGKIDKSYSSILQFLLKDSTNYMPFPSKCEFQPIIAVVFYKQKTSIPLLFCFFCNEWAIIDKDKSIIGMFEYRKLLINFFKPLFPKDELIQKL